jgi:hypothetical protein
MSDLSGDWFSTGEQCSLQSTNILSPIFTDSYVLLGNLRKIVIFVAAYYRHNIRPANRVPEMPQIALFHRP